MVTFGLALSANAQFFPNINAPYNSPTYLINNVLLGNGVTATNIIYQGSALQIGHFTGGTSGNVNVGIDSGIVISTGEILDIAGGAAGTIGTTMQTANNTPSDADILDIIQTNNASGSANDAAIIEFDFVPLGDTVRFDYMFGSDEYPEFVCSFNDGFGMFLSGPGITGPYTNNSANIAIVPGTNPPLPVSIYNVNQTAGTCAWANNNANLYVSNTGGTDFAFDGFTKVFTAKSGVQCGQTYHLKIAIADANDHSFDSGVILRAQSLVSTDITLSTFSSAGAFNDTVLVEGCQPGRLKFHRNTCVAADTMIVHLTYSPLGIPPSNGSATYGVDYDSLPSSITFLPTVNDFEFPVNAFQDGIAESNEGFLVSFYYVDLNGDTVSNSRGMSIIVPDTLIANVNDITVCPGDSATLTAIPTGGFAPFNYLWSTGDTSISISVLQTSISADYWVTITSTCLGTTSIDTGTVYVAQNNPITITTTGSITDVTENCGDTVYVSIALSYPTIVPLNLPVSFTSGFGFATNGVDFGTINNQPFPSSIDFAIGDSVMIIPIVVTPDAVFDPNEFIDLNLLSTNQCSGTVIPIAILINQFDSAIINFTNPSPVCPNVSVPISFTVSGTNSALGTYTYSWDNNTSTATSANFVFTNTATVIAHITDEVCGQPYTTSKPLTITVQPPLIVADITSNKDTVLCPNDAVMLSVAATGSVPLTYSWPGLTSTSNNASVNPTATQTYLVNVSDVCNPNGITKSKTIVVPIYNDLIIDLITDTVVNCPGTFVQLIPTILGGASGKLFSWNGITSPSKNINVNVNDSNAIVYKFQVTDVCNDTATAYTNLKYRTYHSIVLSAADDTSACPDAKIPVYAHIIREGSSTENFTYNWVSVSAQNLIATNNQITGTDSIFTFTILTDVIDTMYYILTATDVCGTSAADTMQVVRKSTCQPKTFNVFSPGSGSNNSRFSIKAIEEYPNTEVVIFDRWGKKVFETANYKNNDPSNSWDGANVDGGTFFYIATFKVPPGQSKAPEPIKGFVEVMK